MLVPQVEPAIEDSAAVSFAAFLRAARTCSCPVRCLSSQTPEVLQGRLGLHHDPCAFQVERGVSRASGLGDASVFAVHVDETVFRG